jgi:hypothetical protein
VARVHSLGKCQELDVHDRTRANTFPAILSQPGGLHSPVGSARGLLAINSVTIPQQQDRRQHVRTRVLWPVVVEAGTSRYLSQAVDISTHGAKVRTRARLKTGTEVRLEMVPPAGPRLRIGALVWRVDPGGLAFLFARAIEHRSLRARTSAHG